MSDRKAAGLYKFQMSSNGLAEKVLRGSAYSVTSSMFTLVLGLTRAILLARLLAPAYFGVVALAMFYVGLVSQLRSLGLDQAFIHQQNNQEKFLRTYFTLRVLTSLVPFLALAASVPFLSKLYPHMPQFPQVLIALLGVELFRSIVFVQESILRKSLAFRQLAITDIVASISMTLIAPLLAWQGLGVWALVSEQAVGIFARLIMVWIIFNMWSPWFGWDKKIARWFFEYGKSVWVTGNLSFLVDRFDDLWVGTVLGKNPLGYYSRAYEFARYPRRVVANPLVGVFMPTFARLQEDRTKLSRAFYRASYVILRTGILVAGAFALIMPEFIHLIIGDKWLPMLLTFRLMLIYTLLDSLLLLSRSLLLAVGRPKMLEVVLFSQTAFFVPAVILGAFVWGINGVALAADGMLVVGALVMYHQLRRLVDFSLSRLGFWPLAVFMPSFAAGLWVEHGRLAQNVWLIAGWKLVIFVVLYVALLGAIERVELIRGVREAWASMRHNESGAVS